VYSNNGTVHFSKNSKAKETIISYSCQLIFSLPFTDLDVMRRNGFHLVSSRLEIIALLAIKIAVVSGSKAAINILLHIWSNSYYFVS
jgi:hypothetical protein